ncbi:Spo4-Spo6 kinase complex regulatory subunit Spo6 [Schizosaccharomyces pombe]|uniref:Sporulation-specific protein 6 n=1 Tax=Schizosaccharomyces pombe (strain 972 / ATCC 24843) TaxID=284812 RepID=SPO6_SCHPO|nr:Spo4-Spo6 kinase complex regulatory subunit Spo6 [Schizosaccharomyces pombe]Q9Y7J1.1 RecName: Full=Sporulation-specific protein 6 [Schizosaccharomyces pombe 972h-]BAA82783.1 Spo6 [Schizosaccharomyces pombe]CAB39799.1 Spo4-Spo6 kinase complex regulatory subunit Spo6 [Schizosaccharomyces pombe]|eukprot:NP_596287.1 Spo4-Spo6 kinase complex regulatory subunit Spo6 [Schizosaccharomyces pombe]
MDFYSVKSQPFVRSPLVDQNPSIQNINEEVKRDIQNPLSYKTETSDKELCQTAACATSCSDWYPQQQTHMPHQNAFDSAKATAKMALPPTAFSNYCVKPSLTRNKDIPRTSIRVSKLRYWQRDYRLAFPNFIFYFDNVDEEIKRRVTQKINNLGAKVATLFTFEVTHFITTRTTDPEMCQPNDVLYLSKTANMKIWLLDKLLNRILFTLLNSDSLVNTSASCLQSLLDGEKVYGTSDKDFYVPSKNVEYFREYFLCIRDLSQYYKPIAVREWEKTLDSGEILWPSLAITAQGRCPFNTGRRRELKITKHNHPAHEIRKQLLSCTNQTNQNNVVKNSASVLVRQIMGDYNITESAVDGAKQMPTEFPKPENLLPVEKRAAMSPLNLLEPRLINKQNTLANQSPRQPPNAFDADPLAHKKVKIETKSGYCENCCERYKDLERHLGGKHHRRFAEKDENFQGLDDLFLLIRRPIRTN